MRGDAIPIGRIGGIQIRIHVTWFIIALLVSWSLAGAYFPDSVAGYSTGAYWAAGIAVTLLFFLSLLLHELAHSLVARARGLRVVGITLYLFGGVSEIGAEATTPDDEFRVTVVGPLTSFALAAVFGVLWAGLGGLSALVSSALGYLAVINLFLGLFNLLPGLPLDGGRLLQALVWRRTGDHAHATRVAVGAGVVVGYLMIAVGIAYVFTGYWVNGLWLIFLGWYLQRMAGQERRAAQTHALFDGLRVADLTDTHPYVVAPETRLDQVIPEVIMAHQVRAVPVLAGDRFRGLLILDGIARVPREDWSATPVADVMIPADEVATATPNESAEDAIAEMQERDIDQLLVVQDGALVGLLSRGATLRQLENRARLTPSR
jgi:Zn-dependent protease